MSLINDIFVQSDGKAVVVGEFSNYTNVSCGKICRLLSDGQIDPTMVFGAGFSGGSPLSVLVGTTKRIYVAGDFTSFDGNSTPVPFVRLLESGEFDPTFSAAGLTKIFSIALQGFFIVTGYIASTGKTELRRIQSTGAVEPTFTAISTTEAEPSDAPIAIQSDSKILYAFGGIRRAGVNGGVDATFSTGTNFNGTVKAIKTLSDGSIFAGGNFTTYNGSAAPMLAKLNSSGALQTFVQGSGFNAPVRSLLVSPDGAILYVGGDFTTYNGASAPRFCRLDMSGNLLPSNETITRSSTARSSVSQVEADAQALAAATAHALEDLPCA